MNRAQKRREQREARKQAKRSPIARASLQRVQQASPSADLPEDKRELLEAFDGFAPLRNGLRRIAEQRGDWAGIPMPLDNERLVLEPKYPMAEALMAMGKVEKDDPLPADVKQRNCWWSSRLKAEIYIWDEGGKIQWGKIGRQHHIMMDLHTLGCAEAWGIEQEARAVQLLGTLVSHRQFKQYMLTGMFMETSKRSGVCYVFRRLKPTVALDMDHKSGRVGILACLCMHTIGYYLDTWAGALCPTDDVIAFLVMMRGDEHMLWKRSNQHHPGRPEAGL